MSNAALATIGHNNPPAPVTDIDAVKAMSPAALYQDGGLEPLIDAIEKEALENLPDASTDENRAAIKSAARKVASLKTAIDEHGKTIVKEWKEKSKVVDKVRSTAWDRLEALQKEMTADVNAYEAKEKARKEAHTTGILTIKNMMAFAFEPSVAEIETRFKVLDGYKDTDWEEFSSQAEPALFEARKILAARMEAAMKAAADAAELEKLRQENVARAQQERDKQLNDAALADPPAAPHVAVDMARPGADKTVVVAIDPEVERRRKINIETAEAIEAILDEYIEGVGHEVAAREIVRAIAQGRFPHITVKY